MEGESKPGWDRVGAKVPAVGLEETKGGPKSQGGSFSWEIHGGQGESRGRAAEFQR